MIDRVAYLSYHTSPLAQPGASDAGGMNVYIHELAQTMARRGVEVDVFPRRTDANAAAVEDGGGYRVHSVPAGPAEAMSIGSQAEWIEEYAARVIELTDRQGYDVVHSHYWQSGWVGLKVKQATGIPMANSFRPGLQGWHRDAVIDIVATAEALGHSITLDERLNPGR